MRKNIRTIVAVAVIIALGALSCVYAGKKVYRKYLEYNDYKTVVNSSQLLLSRQNQPFNYDKPLRVVCLGNSITRHEYLPEVEWYSDWGMAASEEENDYCHILQRKLRQYNEKSEVIPLNIARFETNPRRDIDSLIGNTCDSADIIVINIGENVRDAQTFGENIQRLIDKCKQYTPHIVIAGCFWVSGDVEKVLLGSAIDNNLNFVPLSWIGAMRNAYIKQGDTIIDREGKPYVLQKNFVSGHPNDEGMERIAEAIFNAITLLPINN